MPAVAKDPEPVTQKPIQKSVEQPPAAPQVSEPLYIGLHDMDMLEFQKEIVQQVLEVWHAPTGFASAMSSTLKVTVAADGTIAHVLVDTSSGVLAFDMAACNALYNLVLPKYVWAKDIYFVLTN